ncbi:MAG: exo-alpha-sialidase [Bacteroidaceae bacterium]|nr:exo-alpha-sialidase [Bacteroidaceae bacterium]
MNFKFRLSLASLAMLLVSTLTAAEPFKTTTIVDGQFATGTTWYTMQIGASQHVISDNAGADRIALTKISSTLDAADLWCFVGNATDGYQIYNKQAGATKVLASSTTMSKLEGYGGTGGSTYPTLQPVDALPQGYVGAWDLQESDKLADTEGYFVVLHGTDYAMNNFGGVGNLAFWAEGKDVGSTVTFAFAETTVEINKANGVFTASNANKTWHAVWASSQLDGFTLGTGANNMTTSGDYIAAYSGTSGNCTHTLTAPQGMVVAGYSFDFVNTNNDASYSLNLVVDGKTYNTSAEQQHVEVSGLTERMATYTQSGANKGITLSNYIVTVRRSMVIPEPQFDVFPTPTSGAIPYRIPGIAKAFNGDLIAVADYRHSRADIGMATNGRIDIHARISKDNGKTWGDIFPIVEGLGGNAPDLTSMYVAFGDPCIVADRESSRVMVLTCSGNVSFPNGTRNNHQGIARFYSEDNGQTWGKPIDISEAIYEQFDKRVNGGIRCMFIGSGKISQSSTVKVGDYYRLYCAPLVKLADGSNVNFVLYSDDFGGTWKVLGGVDVSPIPSGGDEPKADELPDGSVLISSRTSGGRIYNIYSFTNTATGEGRWGNAVWSNNGNNGTVAVGNSTNGEIMFVPVVRKADSKNMYLMLQSVPFGSGRANVGIYYKEFESLADFVTPDSIAKDWDGRHQASFLSSAYSTMCLQADNTVGFLYEEDTYGTSGGGYTIVYKNYSIEQLTDSAYAYDANIDPNAFVAANIDVKTAGVVAGNNYVGAYTPEAVDMVQGILAVYKENPGREVYEKLNSVLASLPVINVQPNGWYRLRNAERNGGKLYLTPGESKYTAANSNNLVNAHQVFCFKPTETEGQYYLYSGNYATYLGKLGAVETEPIVTADAAEAGVWSVVPSPDGKCQVVCINFTGNKKGLHLAGDNKRLVPWNESGSPASLWFVEPVETFPVDVTEEGFAAISLPFGVKLPEGVTAYVAVGETVIDGVNCIELSTYGDGYCVEGPVVLSAEPGHYELPLFEAREEVEQPENLFGGTLRAAAVSGKVFLFEKGMFKKKTTSGNVAANKVYYVSETETTSFGLVMEYEPPTAIEGVAASNKAVKFFDLNGRPVVKPTRGIYVTSDGRKVLVK